MLIIRFHKKNPIITCLQLLLVYLLSTILSGKVQKNTAKYYHSISLHKNLFKW